MSDLSLTVIGQISETLTAALKEFEREHRLQVEVELLEWDVARSQLVDFALFKTGPDVSEVGSTWLSSFRAMNALRPYADSELTGLGGERAFLTSLWQCMQRHDQIWAIPWTADTRALFYRQDVLADLNIDPKVGLATPAAFRTTLRRIKEEAAITPLTIPTTREAPTFHLAVPWVWHHGGHFLRADGRKTLFAEPAARAGLVDYFETLLPYTSPEMKGLRDFVTTQRFWDGHAAMTISGHWLLWGIRSGQWSSEIVDNVGVAMSPVTPFVGGTGLVVWRHTRRERQAVQLAQHLASVRVQQGQVREMGFLPALEAVLHEPPFTTDPGYEVLAQSLYRGQALTATYLWGLVEDKLTAAIAHMWRRLYDDPGQDVAQLVKKTLTPLARQLDRTLADR